MGGAIYILAQLPSFGVPVPIHREAGEGRIAQVIKCKINSYH